MVFHLQDGHLSTCRKQRDGNAMSVSTKTITFPWHGEAQASEVGNVGTAGHDNTLDVSERRTWTWKQRHGGMQLGGLPQRVFLMTHRTYTAARLRGFSPQSSTASSTWSRALLDAEGAAGAPCPQQEQSRLSPRMLCRDRWLGLEEKPLVMERDGAALEGDVRELAGEDRLLPTWWRANPLGQPGARGPKASAWRGGISLSACCLRPRSSLLTGSQRKRPPESGHSYQAQPAMATHAYVQVLSLIPCLCVGGGWALAVLVNARQAGRDEAQAGPAGRMKTHLLHLEQEMGKVYCQPEQPRPRMVLLQERALLQLGARIRAWPERNTGQKQGAPPWRVLGRGGHGSFGAGLPHGSWMFLCSRSQR